MQIRNNNHSDQKNFLQIAWVGRSTKRELQDKRRLQNSITKAQENPNEVQFNVTIL